MWSLFRDVKGQREMAVAPRENLIDRVSDATGRAVSVLVVIMIGVVCYNVFVRYVLNSPTSWSYDVTYLLGGSMMALGQAFVYKHDEHVRIDVVSVYFSERARLIIETVFTAVFFIPLIFFVSLTYWKDFRTAFLHGDTLMQTAWYPPVWPFKLLIAIGFTLLLAQGVARLISLIITLKSSGGADHGAES